MNNYFSFSGCKYCCLISYLTCNSFQFSDILVIFDNTFRFLLRPWEWCRSIVMSTSVCVCVCVCPWAYLLNHTYDLYQFFVHPVYGHGSVLLWRGDAIPREGAISGVLFHIDNALYGPYSSMNFATKDQFGLNLLICHKVGRNSIFCY